MTHVERFTPNANVNKQSGPTVSYLCNSKSHSARNIATKRRDLQVARQSALITIRNCCKLTVTQLPRSVVFNESGEKNSVDRRRDGRSNAKKRQRLSSETSLLFTKWSIFVSDEQALALIHRPGGEENSVQMIARAPSPPSSSPCWCESNW